MQRKQKFYFKQVGHFWKQECLLYPIRCPAKRHRLVGKGMVITMAGKRSYIFTNKEHPEKGIMSTILGILSVITFGAAIYLSYLNNGEENARYGAAGVLAVIFMIAGFILGGLSLTEKEKFKLFPVLGIVMNTVAFLLLSLILYAGAYVS